MQMKEILETPVTKGMDVWIADTARVFGKFPWLRQKRYWGNHFWARGYCVDTIGLDLEKIRKYIKYQENLEKQMEIRG